MILKISLPLSRDFKTILDKIANMSRKDRYMIFQMVKIVLTGSLNITLMRSVRFCLSPLGCYAENIIRYRTSMCP